MGEFEGSQETVEELANSSLDVILMDIDMPIMNGIECVKNIRKLDSIQSVIIFYVPDSFVHFPICMTDDL